MSVFGKFYAGSALQINKYEINIISRIKFMPKNQIKIQQIKEITHEFPAAATLPENFYNDKENDSGRAPRRRNKGSNC